MQQDHKPAALFRRFVFSDQAKDPRLARWVFGLFAIMLVLALAHSWVNPWLAYDRNAVLDGQLWRLLTCHFVHLNLNHFLLDGSGFLLVWWVFQDVLTRRLLAWWLGISAPICGLLLLADPGLQGYVGLSGLLHGWLVIALLAGWRTAPWLHSLALLLVAGKLAYEQSRFYDADYLGNLIHGSVYASAHLDGALTGLGIMLLLGGWRWLNRKA
jgi:rhomboid family GlyGly-CTERM serine protease